MSNKGLKILDFRESWLRDVAAYQEKVKSQQLFLQLSKNPTERSLPAEKPIKGRLASKEVPKKEDEPKYVVNTYHAQLLKRALLKDPALLGRDLQIALETALKSQNHRQSTDRSTGIKKDTPQPVNARKSTKPKPETTLPKSPTNSEQTPTKSFRTPKVTVPEAHIILDNIHRTLNTITPRKHLTENRVHEVELTQPKETILRPTLEKQLSADEKTSDDSALGDELADIIDDDDLSEISTDTEDEYSGYVYRLSETNTEIDDDDDAAEEKKETISELNARTIETASETPFTPNSILMPSLFPQVPPYITFYSDMSTPPSLPSELQQVLKWKHTTVTPKIVRYVVENTGMRLLRSNETEDWLGTWDKHMKSPEFKDIEPYQKYNHLPGSFKIGRKDSLWRGLKGKIEKFGKKEFGFMRKTYLLPEDMAQFKRVWFKYYKLKTKWIVKPPASARGFGVRLISEWSEIPQHTPTLIQKYIERPLLINGNKFDLRLYVVITSVDPLRIFLHNDGLVRFASVQYSNEMNTIHDRCMHLTNYSINKLSQNYMKNEEVGACNGHKWTLKALWTYFRSKDINVDEVWSKIRNLIVRTMLVGEHAIGTLIRHSVNSKNNCYELLGFDVLLDEKLTPWLLEVNISPSLHIELPLDRHVKGPLVQSMLNIVSFQVPPKLSMQHQKEILAQFNLSSPLCYDKRLYMKILSNEEVTKQKQFTRKSIESRDEYLKTILDNLTPDDVRCLIIAEDELARCSPMERIFPTATSHTYLQYLDTPRYYNRLLDAWETRYASNRNEGIDKLRKLCEEGFHLIVPTSMVTQEDSSKEHK